jgi:quinol monooxygenase YgiN
VGSDRITLVCFIMAKEEAKLRVREELKHIASMTQKEAGNINYFLHVLDEDDKVFVIYENWKDQMALDDHMAQPYLKKFLDKMDEWLECPVKEKVCRIL